MIEGYKSSFDLLDGHSIPVNKVALRVGFLAGENFEADFSERKKFRLTFDYPPRAAGSRPPLARDYTGLRCGRMVAGYFHREKENSGGRYTSVWVCRCDCGRYEFRKPYKWAKGLKKSDMCEVCEREQEMLSGGGFRKSKKTMPDRLMRWAGEMNALGLDDNEICAIRVAGVDTHGRSIDEIRSDLNGCVVARA